MGVISQYIAWERKIEETNLHTPLIKSIKLGQPHKTSTLQSYAKVNKIFMK